MDIRSIKLRRPAFRAERRGHALVGEALAHHEVHGESPKACHALETEATHAMLRYFVAHNKIKMPCWYGSVTRSSWAQVQPSGKCWANASSPRLVIFEQVEQSTFSDCSCCDKFLPAP